MSPHISHLHSLYLINTERNLKIFLQKHVNVLSVLFCVLCMLCICGVCVFCVLCVICVIYVCSCARVFKGLAPWNYF